MLYAHVKNIKIMFVHSNALVCKQQKETVKSESKIKHTTVA